MPRMLTLAEQLRVTANASGLKWEFDVGRHTGRNSYYVKAVDLEDGTHATYEVSSFGLQHAERAGNYRPLCADAINHLETQMALTKKIKAPRNTLERIEAKFIADFGLDTIEKVKAITAKTGFAWQDFLDVGSLSVKKAAEALREKGYRDAQIQELLKAMGYNPDQPYKDYKGFYFKPGVDEPKKDIDVDKWSWSQVEPIEMKKAQIDFAKQQQQAIEELLKFPQKWGQRSEEPKWQIEPKPAEKDRIGTLPASNAEWAVIEPNIILEAPYTIVFIEPFEYVFGPPFMPNARRRGDKHCTSLRLFAKSLLADGKNAWVFNPKGSWNTNPYAQWIVDLKEVVANKDLKELNLSVMNMHLEWWREKGLL
jgi:hypothetical protein